MFDYLMVLVFKVTIKLCNVMNTIILMAKKEEFKDNETAKNMAGT